MSVYEVSLFKESRDTRRVSQQHMSTEIAECASRSMKEMSVHSVNRSPATFLHCLVNRPIMENLLGTITVAAGEPSAVRYWMSVLGVKFPLLEYRAPPAFRVA